MGLKEEILSFQEPMSRMVSNCMNPSEHSTDNGPLFTSTYYVLLEKLGLLSDTDKIVFRSIVEAITEEPGKILRFPGTDEVTRQDDIIGVAAAAYFLDYPQTAASFYHYGDLHLWFWSDASFPLLQDKASFLGRYPDFIAFLRACAGAPIPWFERITAALSIFVSCFSVREDTSGKCLMYLKQRVLFGKSKLIDVAINFWRAQMIKMYPGGMKEVYGIYFGLFHPFAKYGPDDFS